MGKASEEPRLRARSDHPPLTIADSAQQARHRVWHLLALAFLGIALPLAIGGYALRQAAASQRNLIETSRLAQADVLAAQVSGTVLDLRKDVIALSQQASTSAVLSLGDARQGVSVLDLARTSSPHYGALALLDADDVALAVSPGTAGEVFTEIAESPDTQKSLTGLRRDGEDVVWIMRFTVRNAAGQRVGSLAAAISLRGVLRAHTQVPAGGTLTKALVDDAGEILVSTDKAAQGQRVKAPEVLSALQLGERKIIQNISNLGPGPELTAIVPVVQAPFLVQLSQSQDEVDAPLALVERWLWLGFLALTLSSAGMFWHALRTFRHYDRRLIRECSLATGVIDGTSDMVFVKDAEGRYLLVNEPAAAFLHRSKEEIVGNTVGDVMTPEDATITRKNDLEVLESGRPSKREFRGIDPETGKPYVVWTARHPLRDRQGSVAAIVGVTRDVTERHRLIDALREGEQRVRLIADNLPALVAYVDREERYRFVNARLVESLGPDAPSPLGRTLREVSGDQIHADQTEHVAAALGGELVTFEGRFSVRGRQHIFRSTFVPDVGPEGDVRGFYAMTFDITDFKTVETLLAANEAKLRLIADNIPVLVSYVDHERRFRFNNAAYADWLGLPLVEITGRPLRDVLDPRLYSLIEPHLDAAFQGTPAEFEFTSPQTQRVFRGTYLPDFNDLGETAGVYGVIHDVTAQKEIERTLRQEAQIDPLTGLLNRRPFMKLLQDAIARSERNGARVAVMFLDLDHLKSINDRFGHQVGDLALREFARRLSSSVRSTDSVGRIAGDEFVILMEAIHDAEEATLVAEKIRTAVQAPFDLMDKRIVLSASIGVALRRAGEIDAADFLQRADAAMYAIKRSGRGGCQVDS